MLWTKVEFTNRKKFLWLLKIWCFLEKSTLIDFNWRIQPQFTTSIILLFVIILLFNFLKGYKKCYSTVKLYTLNLIYYIGTYGLSYFTILIFLIPGSIIQIYDKDSMNFILKTYISTSLIIALLSIVLIFIRFGNNINKEKFTLD